MSSLIFFFLVLLFFIFGILIFQKKEKNLFSFFLMNYTDIIFFFVLFAELTFIRFLKLIFKKIGGRGPSVLWIVGTKGPAIPVAPRRPPQPLLKIPHQTTAPRFNKRQRSDERRRQSKGPHTSFWSSTSRVRSSSTT